MLKFRIDKTAHETLTDIEKALYKADGDDYILQVEGVVDKNRLDEFRNKNVDLLKEMDKFKNIDIDKYNLALEQEQKLKDKQLIDAGDIETLLQQKTSVITSDYEAKILALTEKLDSNTAQHNSMIGKYEIEGVANRAFTENKISPDAVNAVMSQIKAKFVIENGSVVAKDGDKIITGKNGNLTISEFVQSQPEIFKIQSSGGGGNGSNNNGNNDDRGQAKREAYEKLIS